MYTRWNCAAESRSQTIRHPPLRCSSEPSSSMRLIIKETPPNFVRFPGFFFFVLKRAGPSSWTECFSWLVGGNFCGEKVREGEILFNPLSERASLLCLPLNSDTARLEYQWLGRKVKTAGGLTVICDACCSLPPRPPGNQPDYFHLQE